VLDFALQGKYLRIMAALSGTSTLDWARSIIVPELSFDEVEEGMGKIPPGCEGVLYLPYIYGERAPFKNASACGGFYGLTERHGRFHLIRAAYEGLALSMYDCYMNLPPVSNEVYIAGGGAQSSFLCQLFSDCLGKPVIRKKIREPGIQGVYYLLREAFNVGIEVSEFSDFDVFMPDNANHVVYMRLYKLFKELRGSMKRYWKERAHFIRVTTPRGNENDVFQ
jgi:sugar (pentulose or hexulose) kinase